MIPDVEADEVAPLRLLIVEDSPSDAALLEASLRDSPLAAATVDHEVSLEGARRRLGSESYDAVLLDLGLPDSDGLDTFRQTCAFAGSAAVVVITARDDPGLAQEAVRLGAQDYLPKTEFRPGDFGRAVDYAVRRSRLLTDLRRARDEQLDAKDRFLSHVSHELRSPLSVVHQFASLLLDGVSGPLSMEQLELLNVLIRNVDQLKVMLNDLLEASHAQRGQLTVESHAVSLDELLSDAVAAQRPNAEQRGIQLAVAPVEVPPVIADAARVREVLANLLDNAMKFTPDGGAITVSAEPGALGEAVHVTVRDTGRGIAPEDLGRIFEQFFQAHQGDEVSRNGLGLGLYVCRDLVQRMRGEMWADSEVGRGTAVSFSLPMLKRHSDLEVAR